jgi:hypothetical protein
MEANNGYEYKVLKVRHLGFGIPRATERAIKRATAEGWSVVNISYIDGLVTTPVVTVKRPQTTPPGRPASLAETAPPLGEASGAHD